MQAATVRNHPLLLLSGVGTNAIGYDLSPQISFARHMSGQGFDTWILEVRGAGLKFTKSQTLIPLPFPHERLVLVVEVLEEFQRQVDLFQNSDWDLDQLLKEDLPLVFHGSNRGTPDWAAAVTPLSYAADYQGVLHGSMEYIRTQSKPRDGKLLTIGHSMGGILLYAMLSLYGFEGRDPHLAAVTTLASSLDYSSSRSSFRLLLPVADPAKALKVTAIPIGAVMAALYPLASYPPFLLSWLNAQISAQDMMIPELFERLVQKNFCTVPARLLLQLATVFERTGLADRSRTFFYKEHLHRTNVPMLAVAGDQDLICPPEAVYETIKKIPEHMVTYRVFGEPRGPHYAHYDLVGGRYAAKEVYPCILEFLVAHDKLIDGWRP
ncbi:hypothetical protein Cgig2_021579 [Carnegiea gigantea]|uniref:AB hydrolase-1 domain-containing protein n=1 Tax=Carnegiea gigantea TaxID=171969 RepID=A0A9Q1Q648_9CARY|nr:hypothetical protein Cgig2_021579 [Carnegiea gigantea]